MKIEDKKVMVIGGGIAGLTAAYEMARQGVDVDLVEKADFLGGYAIQYACKATDECQQCGACSVEKMLKNVVETPGINIHLATQVEKVSGSGPFTVTLKSGLSPDAERTSGKCGDSYADNPRDCAAAWGYSKHNAGFYDAAGKLDPAKSGAVDSLTVDAIVVASGFKPFAAEQKPTYNYGKMDNVITGLDLERGKRAMGTVVRPSDGKVPETIAFIQCVGSRDERLGNLWCSQVCCPYALRTAGALKHKNPDMDITVFYMDIQNAGKSYPQFYEKCKEEMRFVRAIPVDMYKTEDDKIQTRYMDDDGRPVEDVFDLMVLSVGITPGADNRKLAEILGIGLDQDGFFQSTDMLNKALTSRQGVFMAGTIQGPKTIADSMTHAGQAAREAMKFVGEAK